MKPKKKVPRIAGAKVYESRLRNGLQVILAERHGDPVVAVQLLYRVGSRDEQDHEAGISHFLEHMMFKGSAGYAKGEVDLLTTVAGGDNNAFTTRDHTGYWFEFASDRWEQALAIEADRMRALSLEPEEFDSERKVVLEELAMWEDDAWERLSQEVQLVLFAGHPYQRPVIGYPESLRRLEVRHMRDYHARHYHPANAVLVIAGDVRPTSALRAVRKHFGKIPAGPAGCEGGASAPVFREPRGERRVELAWDDEGKRMLMAWPAAIVGERDDYALDLVATLLSSGRNSRLHRRLVLGDSLATALNTRNDSRVDVGSFRIYAECAPGVEPRALEAAIDEELERLARERVSARELERARSILEAEEAFELESVADLANEIGGMAVDCDWRHLLDSAERYAEIKPGLLRECAARLLRRDRRVVGWSLPSKAEARP